MKPLAIVAIALALAVCARGADEPQPADSPTPSVIPDSNRLQPEAVELDGSAAHPSDALKPIIELRGRIHADAIFVNQSLKDKAIIGDLQNAVGFQRARLGAQGTVGDQVRWVAEFDFAGGDIVFKDVYVALEELPIIRQIRVGHFPEPFSLEGEISSNGMTFIERSPQYALDPDRNWGVGIYTYTEDKRVTLAVGAFRSGTGNNGNDIGDANDMAYTSRVTGLPWYDSASDGRYLFMIGSAFSYRYPPNQVVTFK